MKKSQREANLRWDRNHQDRLKFLRYRSYTKTFILKLSESDDLNAIEKMVEERRKHLKKGIDGTPN